MPVIFLALAARYVGCGDLMAAKRRGAAGWPGEGARSVMVPKEETAASVSYLRTTMKLAALSLRVTFRGVITVPTERWRVGWGHPNWVEPNSGNVVTTPLV